MPLGMSPSDCSYPPYSPMLLCIAPDHPSSVFPSGWGKEERECCGASKVSIKNSEPAHLIPGVRTLHIEAGKVVISPKIPQALLSANGAPLPPVDSGCLICWHGCQGGCRGGAGVVYTIDSGACSPLFLVSSRSPHVREMEGMGYGPRRALPLTCVPPLLHFTQRPGMSPGSRMPMAGMQVGPPAGSPFGTAAPLRPGMPPTMMDPFRKRLLVPQAQPPMPAQRRG